VPQALKALHTHSEVSPRILGGADLMLQGVIQPPTGLGDFEEGDKRSVALPNNHLPFGVGCMVVSSDAVATTGLKGRGLKLLHHFPDACVPRVCVPRHPRRLAAPDTHASRHRLWAMGDKSCPDPSFSPERVYPLGTAPPAPTAAPNAPPPASAVANGVQALTLDDPDNDAPPPPPPPAASTVVEAGAPTPESTATPEGMDTCLDWCLLRALVTAVPDGALPIRCEELYSKVMLPARPAGTTVDIKKSGYKKLTKLFSVWEKKGLLTVKPVHKIDSVTAVNRTHASYLAASQTATAAESSATAAAAGGGAAAGAAAPAAAASTQHAHIGVDVLYRVPSSLRPVFGDMLSLNKERLLSETEVVAALCAYAKAAPAPSAAGVARLVLDELLAGSLYGKKEPECSGSEVEVPVLLARLLGKLNQFTRLRITRAGGGAPEEVLQKGAVKNIHVQAEDRHAGRKHVTRVSGMEQFAIDPDELATRIQKTHNTSCSVQPLPGKNETGKEVAAQGMLLVEVCALLREAYGIPPSYIEAVDKTK
jgi:translation initiation factor 2D